MSYCRFSDGDVYAYPTAGGNMHIHVKGWPRERPHAGAFWEVDRRVGADTLRMLASVGWDVPDYAIAEAEADADDYEGEVTP